MKAFLDTSVLVAAFYEHHENHKPSFELLVAHTPAPQRANACTAAHCLAEVYATLTGMPGKDRASGDEAMLFLGSVRERLAIVALDTAEYFGALEEAATLGVTGGGFYDALIGRCALKAKAQTIYTWNVRHFKRLGPDIASRVQSP